MNNVNDRLLELIKATGLSKNQFSKKIGTSSAMISKLTNQNVNFGIDIVEKIISTYPQLNINWLLTGIGEMWINNHNYHPQQLIQESDKSYLLDLADINDEELIKVLETKIKQISFLYQRLVDIRILLDEEANVKKQYSSDKETELLWDLARPSHKNNKNQKVFKYELFDHKGKVQINKELDECIKVFTDTYFNEFRELYTFLRSKRGTI